MSTTVQLQLPPIPASIENPDAWGTIAQQVSSASGVPLAVTPQQLTAMFGSAVPLLFESDRAGKSALLRGTFADLVIAQRQRNIGDLRGARPTAVTVHLVGAHMADAHPVLRAHLAVQVQLPSSNAGVFNQFWDVQLGAQVTVGAETCPNCGAPLASGELVCGYCHTDVRSVADVPLVVCRLELY